MGQIKFITSFLLIGLFSLAVINFMVGFASDNNAVVDLADDSEFSNLSTYSEARLGSEYTDKVNLLSGQFENSTIDLGSETTRTGRVYKDGGFPETYKTFKGLLNVVQEKIFGGKGSEFSFILSSFAGIILIIFGMLAYKTWKGGNPE